MKLLEFLHKPQTRNLLDELPYWDILEGVMILKNGRAETGVSLNLLPNLFMPPLEQVVRMSQAALRSTPEGSRARFVTLVTRSNNSLLKHYQALSSAPEEAVQTLTEGRYAFWERRRQEGSITQWRSFMTVAFGGSRTKDRPAISSVELDSILQEGKRLRLRLERFLQGAGLAPKSLSTQEVFDLTHGYLNPSSAGCDLGNYRATEQAYPKEAVKRFSGLRPPTLRAQLLKSPVDNSHPDYLMVGGHYVMMLALHTIPDETFPSMGNLFLRAGQEFAVVIDIHHEPYAKAVRKLKDRNRRSNATVGSDDIYVDADVEEGFSEGRELVRHLRRTNEHIYRVSATVVMMGRDLPSLREAHAMMQSTLAHVPGNPFRPLYQGLFHPWKTVAPFSGEQYEEAVDLVESNAAHLLPVNGVWKGSQRPVALYSTRNRTLASLDSFDPRNKNSHALFLGATRSGKTFTAQYQLSETLRQHDIDATIIDRGLSYARLVHAFGGVIIPVEPGGKVSINPFDLEPNEVKPDEDHKAFLLSLLRAMLPTDGGTTEADEDAILTSAIEEAYDAHREDYVGEGGVLEKRFTPFILSDFVTTLLTLSAVGDRPVTLHDREIAQSLARRLQVWCGDTPLGRFIDRPTSFPENSARVVLYETSAFGKQARLDAVGTMLIQRAVWKRATRSKQRKMIMATDEAWAVLNNPYAVKFLEEMLRRGAKEGVAVWLLTHSIRDLMGEGKTGILQSLSSFYLFQTQGEAPEIQAVLELDDATMEAYSSLTGRKGEYNEFLFYTRREDQREGDVLALYPSPTDYWTFTNHQEDLARLELLTQELGSEQAAIKVLARGQEV